MLTLEDNRQNNMRRHVASLLHHNRQLKSTKALLLNHILTLSLYVHVFTNSAVFQLPEGKMLSYFGFVSTYYCFQKIPTIHVKVLSHSYTYYQCFHR